MGSLGAALLSSACVCVCVCVCVCERERDECMSGGGGICEESLWGLLVQQGAVKVSHHVAASLLSIVCWGGGGGGGICEEVKSMYEEFMQGLLLQHCCLQSLEGGGGICV